MQCARHPSVETELACGKCGRPICPRCVYHTPVGARCRECANLRRLPQFELSAPFLLRGLGAALGVGAALGALWGFVIPFGTGFFFGLLAGLALGYGVGEAVSVATNRKQAPPLQWVAVGGVVTAYLVRSAVLAVRAEDVGFGELLRGDLFGYVVVVLASVVAVQRLR